MFGKKKVATASGNNDLQILLDVFYGIILQEELLSIVIKVI